MVYVKKCMNNAISFFMGDRLPAHMGNRWFSSIENESGVLLAQLISNDSPPIVKRKLF